MTDATAWAGRIRDARSRRVIFLAHCLLNENTRYLGGARRGGAVPEIVEPCLEQGVGIVQLPCPEQHAWGGVLKRRLLLFYGSRLALRHRLLGLVLPLLLWYTRRIYRRLAREAAEQILDYQRSGFAVLGVVGVDGSPSCGVHQNLRMRAALERLAQLDPQTVSDVKVNAIIRDTVNPGRGLYMELLQKELDKRGVSIAMTAHDLIAELDGKRSSADVQAMLRNAS